MGGGNQYQLKLWNEDNFPIEQYPFAQQAYEQRKWAFVSDVARLHALYYEGGIYLDTDMEIIKSIEPLFNYQAFAHIERSRLLSIGFAGSIPFHPWFERQLSWYKLIPLRTCYNILANTRVISRLTDLHYLIRLNQLKEFNLKDNMHFLPRECFQPTRNSDGSYQITDKTFAIHHGTGMW